MENQNQVFSKTKANLKTGAGVSKSMLPTTDTTCPVPVLVHAQSLMEFLLSHHEYFVDKVYKEVFRVQEAL
jgi:hypothetical protein